jgi:hypothetical protein
VRFSGSPFWFLILRFDQAPDDLPANDVMGGWTFVATDQPKLWDASGRPLTMADEPLARSIVRVAGEASKAGKRRVYTMAHVAVVEAMAVRNPFAA